MFSSQNSQVSNNVNYVEDVFSTYLYTGTGAAQTITNGIDLTGKGGLIWTKSRNLANNNNLVNTIAGVGKSLASNNTAAQQTQADQVTAFNSNGYTLGADAVQWEVNRTGYTYASWTFREQPKFFDVVTYTGNGVSGRVIPSNHDMGTGFLGAVFIKRTDTTSDWKVSFRGGQGGQIPWLSLNQNVADSSPAWVGGNINPEVNGFSVYDYSGDISAVNANGGTYVAYLFAHNAGGFGLNGTDNVITCGTYTGNGLLAGPIVTLGYEPQWVLVKRTNSTGNWMIQDNMRSLSQTNTDMLFPNLSNAATTGAYPSVVPTATGFYIGDNGTNYNASGGTYVYMAIRRGPMAVPTLGTSVFQPVIYSGNGSNNRDIDTTITPDLIIDMRRDNIMPKYVLDRMRANGRMYSNLTSAESTNTAQFPANTFNVNQTGITVSADEVNTSDRTYVLETFRRAPGFFDEVCFTQTTTSGAQAITHNLTVVPELVITKPRSQASSSWDVFPVPLNNRLTLNGNGGASTYAPLSSVTATSFSFPMADLGWSIGVTWVAYLFATCAGVSKVGSYTGTGALQTVACGFTSGARFVLVKATSTTGDWYVWDSARGISSSTDPYLLLNSTAAEVTSTNWVDTDSTGFKLTAESGNNVNTNGTSYIFLAIS